MKARPLDAVRRRRCLRALRRVGLQSGRRQAGAAGRRADHADRHPLRHRSALRHRATRSSTKRRIFEIDGTEAAGALAGALFTAEFIALYESLRFTTAARATVFLYAAPFFVAFGAAFLLKDERLRPIQWVGLGLRLSWRRLRLRRADDEAAASPATRLRSWPRRSGRRRPSSSRRRRSDASIR